jgi:hypothetical protein
MVFLSNKRKAELFGERDIRAVWNRLNQQGWPESRVTCALVVSEAGAAGRAARKRGVLTLAESRGGK